MPLHLADDPAGPVPGLRLILKIDKLAHPPWKAAPLDASDVVGLAS
jgi:hypothetical protein